MPMQAPMADYEAICKIEQKNFKHQLHIIKSAQKNKNLSEDDKMRLKLKAQKLKDSLKFIKKEIEEEKNNPDTEDLNVIYERYGWAVVEHDKTPLKRLMSKVFGFARQRQ